MKNRSIIVTAILLLFGYGALSCTALAQSAVNPARNAVQEPIVFNLQGTSLELVSIPIPAGKIFVLETVSIAARGANLVKVAIRVSGPGITSNHGTCVYELTLPPASNPNYQAGSQALRLYAQPGTPLEMIAQATSSATVEVTLCGYFVDAQ